MKSNWTCSMHKALRRFIES